jgi:hypothetical protein
MKVSRKIRSAFLGGVNARKALSAIACLSFPMSGTSKLTFKTRLAGKPPLHLSRIIHIDSPHRRDTNDLRNKKTGAERPFFMAFTVFLIYAAASARFFAPVSNG